MIWKRSLMRVLAWLLGPRDLVALAAEMVPGMLRPLPRPKRVALLCEITEDIVMPALRDLGPEERAQLMNALLPLIVREFPLADLDLLAAFPAPISSEDAIGA